MEEGSDCPGKRWILQPGKKAPREGQDWKRAPNPNGGGNKQMVVKKAFLKKVALQRYRQKLIGTWRT